MLEGETSPTQDELFEVLSNSRRRQVLRLLSTRESGVPLEEVARHITALENDVPVEQVTDQERRRVYISLYQTHVPALEAIDAVDYDPDDGQLSLGPRAGEVTPYLDSLESPARPWYLYYLALVAVGTVLATLAYVDGGPMGVVSDTVVIVGIMAAFLVLNALNVSAEHCDGLL